MTIFCTPEEKEDIIRALSFTCIFGDNGSCGEYDTCELCIRNTINWHTSRTDILSKIYKEKDLTDDEYIRW